MRLVDHVLHTADGQEIEANLADDTALKQITAHCLGNKLKGGILMHGGFFLGPVSFYNDLKAMSEEQSKLFGMTTVDNVNHLYGNQALKALQRKDGRFINTCLMVTLTRAGSCPMAWRTGVSSAVSVGSTTLSRWPTHCRMVGWS